MNVDDAGDGQRVDEVYPLILSDQLVHLRRQLCLRSPAVLLSPVWNPKVTDISLRSARCVDYVEGRPGTGRLAIQTGSSHFDFSIVYHSNRRYPHREPLALTIMARIYIPESIPLDTADNATSQRHLEYVYEATQLSQPQYSQTQNTQGTALISSQVEPRRKYCT